MSDVEYSNAADGTCQECGEPTEEEWHAYCSDCFAEQHGWRRPNRAALEFQRQDRERTTQLRVLELLTSMEQRLEGLHGRVAQLEALQERVAQLERRPAA